MMRQLSTYFLLVSACAVLLGTASASSCTPGSEDRFLNERIRQETGVIAEPPSNISARTEVAYKRIQGESGKVDALDFYNEDQLSFSVSVGQKVKVTRKIVGADGKSYTHETTGTIIRIDANNVDETQGAVVIETDPGMKQKLRFTGSHLTDSNLIRIEPIQ